MITLHNGYVYPQDVKITLVNGKRVAHLDFSLPCKWTDAAIEVGKKCFLSGWEMARRAYEDEQNDIFMQTVHPRHYAEKLAAKKAHAEGMSVSQFRVYWESIKSKEL